MSVVSGLDCLLEAPSRWLECARIGLVANPTTVDRRGRHAKDLLCANPAVDLRLLFGPEHGIQSRAQDMVGVADAIDTETGLPVISLYGKTSASLSPTREQLNQIDVLIFDVQDIGARYYTYQATMALCMRAAAQAGVRVLVLDRPNPIGGLQVEGGGIEPGMESFCGLYPIPQRHGMTVGELARLYNRTFGIGCDLDVVACEGWQRHQYLDATGLAWVRPSPNMPALDTAILYPGACLVEGTNLSEGRGTSRPFELIGAPFVDGGRLAGELTRIDLPGVSVVPVTFEPTFQKHAGRRCGGVELRVSDRNAFVPLRTGVAILVACRTLWPDELAWRTEPYEFRDDVPAIDLLFGTSRAREAIDAGQDLDGVMQALPETRTFDSGRAAALLY